MNQNDSQINKLIDKISTIQQQYDQQQNNIQYIRNKKKEKLSESDLAQLLPQIKNKEDVAMELRQKKRSAWKMPGYCNDEFSKVPILKPQVLSSWEIQRIFMADRSHKYPKDYKGFQNDYYPKEFGTPDEELLGRAYQDYLQTFKEKFDDFRFCSFKYGNIELDDKINRLAQNNQQPFKYVNTIQSEKFGFDSHQTWENEIQTRFGLSKFQTKQNRTQVDFGQITK